MDFAKSQSQRIIQNQRTGSIAQNYQVLVRRPDKKEGYAIAFPIVTYIASKIDWEDDAIKKVDDYIRKWAAKRMIEITVKTPSKKMHICRKIDDKTLLYQPKHDPNGTS